MLSWFLVAGGTLGVVVSYAGIWVLVAYFAAGLAWWVNVALLFSGPLAAIGAAVACVRPRQKRALIVGSVAAGAWLLLWVLCFSFLGFEDRGGPG